jgi:hypothetical protein
MSLPVFKQIASARLASASGDAQAARIAKVNEVAASLTMRVSLMKSKKKCD